LTKDCRTPASKTVGLTPLSGRNGRRISLRPATSSRRHWCLAAAGLAATVLAGLTGLGAHALAVPPDPVLDVPAVLETAPSEIADADSMDDPAVWVDPADPARSVILGADHADDSLNVYDLTGKRLQRLQLTSANNVDVRAGFPLGGETVPLVALAGAGEFAFFKLDPATRQISNVTAEGASVKQPRATGVCLYHSPVSSLYYAFVTGSTTINQYLLDGQTGKVSPHLVRTIDIQARTSTGKDAPLEACAADDRGRSLFAGESDWSLWRYGAEPGDPAGTSDRFEVDKTYEFGGHFEADIEGHTALNLPNGEGFLIASSQGDATFNVFRSTAPYEFIRKFRVVASATADGCDRTDGVEAVAGNFGPAFPYGFFVCQDNANKAPHPGNMNMKLVRLEQILPEVTTAMAPTTSTTTTSTTQPPPQPQPLPQPQPQRQGPAGAASGYWMLGSRGKVFAFGDARSHGETAAPPGAAVDIEPTPTGNGYWVIDRPGHGLHPRRRRAPRLAAGRPPPCR
jgi:3-phytase (myo-inositol-hexaphosphate 3-phosphohydrolase)